MAALLFQHDQNFSEVQTAKSCDKAMLHAVFVVLFRDSFISTDFTWCIVWMLASELAMPCAASLIYVRSTGALTPLEVP